MSQGKPILAKFIDISKYEVKFSKNYRATFLIFSQKKLFIFFVLITQLFLILGLHKSYSINSQSPESFYLKLMNSLLLSSYLHYCISILSPFLSG